MQKNNTYAIDGDNGAQRGQQVVLWQQ